MLSGTANSGKFEENIDFHDDIVEDPDITVDAYSKEINDNKPNENDILVQAKDISISNVSECLNAMCIKNMFSCTLQHVVAFTACKLHISHTS